LASWLQQGLLSAPDRQTLESYYDNQITGLEAGLDPGEAQLRPASACWDCKRPIALQQDYCRECGAPVKGENVTRLRYLAFVCHEVKKHARTGRLPLATAHAILADANAQIVALRKTLDQGRALMVEPVEPAPAPNRRERPQPPDREPDRPKEPARP